MTQIKLCGLKTFRDIETANRLQPDYIGFIFAKTSSRYISFAQARQLKSLLHPSIRAVGVFVNEDRKIIAEALESNLIDMAQLHGNEEEEDIEKLRMLTNKPLIRAFRIVTEKDIEPVRNCSADYVLLDSGAGTGKQFDWGLIRTITRPYFLAGGLDADTVAAAIHMLRPFAVDVSSGIETEGRKDPQKMAAFVKAVRGETA